ncbi:MAG: hypothetical protein GX557_10645, partial [Chloroflexi bacterium]|nr:hypothetical protein [Chloroflexota bacterium]
GLQERYRDEIASALSYPRDRLWSPHHFNPLAPHDSYVRLREAVQTTIRTEVVARFQGLIEQQRSAIRDTLQSPLFRALPADMQSRISGQAERVDGLLQELTQKLKTAREYATDAAVYGDFPDEGQGQFHTLLAQLGDVARGISNARPKVDDMGRELQKLELTPQEDALLANLQAGRAATDFGAARHASQNMDENDFWRALSGLQAKRRVRIIIERVNHD